MLYCTRSWYIFGFRVNSLRKVTPMFKSRTRCNPGKIKKNLICIMSKHIACRQRSTSSNNDNNTKSEGDESFHSTCDHNSKMQIFAVILKRRPLLVMKMKFEIVRSWKWFYNTTNEMKKKDRMTHKNIIIIVEKKSYWNNSII